MADTHKENIIVKHLSGSHAYGTNIETSDVDYRGIFIADKEFIMTPFYTVREIDDKSEEDTKYYELNNYMKLCMDCNPNILETLWVDESDITFSTEFYDILRSHRHELLSSKAAFTYTGYAHNQFTRMDNHHAWIDKEREAIQKLQDTIDKYKCQQVKDFMHVHFNDYTLNLLNFDGCDNIFMKGRADIFLEPLLKDSRIQMLSKNNIPQKYFIKLVHNYLPEKVLESTFNISDYNYGYELCSYGSNIYAVLKRDGSRTLNNDGSLFIADHSKLTLDQIKQLPCLIVKFNKDEYLKCNDNRNNYHEWKRNRNETRAKMEMNFGYDGKHAMHTVRLLRTAEEILRDGVVNVKRNDAKELLEIRNGTWSYKDLTEYFKSKSTEIREVLYKNSTLPKTPDIKLAAEIIIRIREAYWYNKK